MKVLGILVTKNWKKIKS